MNRDNESFKIGNKKISIGLSWSLIEAKSLSGIKKKAELLVKTTGLHYGLLIENDDDDDILNTYNEEDNKIKSALLALTDDENKNTYIGGHLVANKIKDAAFFTQVANEDDDGANLFWLCAVSSTGRVIAEYDTIVEENELAQRISDLQSFSIDLEIYSPQEYFRIFPDHDVKALELRELTKVVDIQNYLAIDLRKKVNYPLMIASIAALSITSYMLYEYVYKENPVLDDISSGILYEDVYAKQSKVVSDNKRLKNKDSMSQNEYSSLANRQLKEIFDRRFYSKEDVLKNISGMVDVLPQFLVEWELKQISYNKNEFLFLYQRIDGSSGTFNQMKVELDKILKYENIDHEWLGANEELTQASFRINFDSQIEKIYLNKKSNEQSKLNGEKDPTENNFNEIVNIKKIISEYENEANMLSFIDKRWGSKPNEIQESIMAQTSLINGEINKIKSIYKKEKEVKERLQRDDLNGSQHYDVYYNSFLNKSQLHQSYLIGTPVKLSVLPFIELQKKKNKKRRSKKKDVELRPLVSVYEFQIKSKENSTGLDQVQEAMRIIDNKSIIYFNVDYNIKTTEWAIRGNMYETNN
jgi:hypothetical protein